MASKTSAIGIALVATLLLGGADASAFTIFSDSSVNAAGIQDTVDLFRAALGDPNNANNPGPRAAGRREINWDGGGPPVVNGTAPATPFTVFQNTRGATFTTPGIGLTQAADTGGLLSLDLIALSDERLPARAKLAALVDVWRHRPPSPPAKH